MGKLILLAGFFVLLAFPLAFSQNFGSLEALVWNESKHFVTSDNIDVGCWSEERNCLDEILYYFSEQPCSPLKEYYTESVEGTQSDWQSQLLRASVTATCSNQNHNYLCVWVENEAGESDTAQSRQLKIDCAAPTVSISSPSSLAPAEKEGTDSAEIVFNVTEENPDRYIVTIRNHSHGIIYRETENISAGGEHRHNASWRNAPDAVYDVIVVVVDKAGNRVTATNSGAIIIDSPEPPHCKSGWEVYLFGNSSGIENAFNLNDLCTDADRKDDVQFTIDSSDCGALVESISVDSSEYIDIGAPLKNEGIEGSSESCDVAVTASDGLFTEIGSFKITVFKTGELELRVVYNGEEYDADEFGEVEFSAEQGDELCFEIKAQNNRPKAARNPLDLAFVLDGSGSMEEEIYGVKDVIDIIVTNVSNTCVDEEGNPIPGCLKLGAVVMEGSSTHPGFPQTTLTTDYSLVKEMLLSVAVAVDGRCEPWADYTIHSIDPLAAPEPKIWPRNPVTVDPMGWRSGEITRLIIIISDASNDWQEHFCPHSYSSAEIADYANPNGIIVSGIGAVHACDPSGCPLNDSGAELAGELKDVADACNGLAVPYYKDQDIGKQISAKILELVWMEIAADDVSIEKKIGPDWVSEIEGTMITERGGGESSQEICFQVPDNASPGKQDFLIEASIPNSGFNDLIAFSINVQESTGDIHAIINHSGELAEDVSINFDGSLSYDELGSPITSWSWDFGDGATASGKQVFHSFENEGDYTVTLQVESANGSAQSQKILTVSNLPPVVWIECRGTANVAEEIAIMGRAIDVPGDSLQFDWDLDEDGEFNDLSGEDISWSWSSPGQKTISLRVSDGTDSAIAYRQILVERLEGDIEVVDIIPFNQDGEQKSIFYVGENMSADVEIKNTFSRVVSGQELSLELVDRQTGQTIIGPLQSGVFLAVGQTIVSGISFNTSGLSAGNYVIEARIVPVPGEEYISNNSKSLSITIIKPASALPVPEISPAVFVLVLLAVLIVLKRNK